MTKSQRLIKIIILKNRYRLKLFNARAHLKMILESQCLNTDGLRQVAKFGLKVSK